jgi:hypothetical protein
MEIENLKNFTAGETLTVTMPATAGYTSAKLILKKINLAAIIISGTLADSVWTFTVSAATTAGYAAGDYTYQATESSTTTKIVSAYGNLTIYANLETASTAFDPRSADEIILAAVIAVMSGTASQTQKYVQVGDRSLQYMSFSELAEKRAYFEQRVASAHAERTGENGSGTIFTTFRKV